jgi:hypothetical protein
MLIPPHFLPIASLLPLALALASKEAGYGTLSRRSTPRSAELLDISGAGSTPALDTWWNSSLVSVAKASFTGSGDSRNDQWVSADNETGPTSQASKDAGRLPSVLQLLATGVHVQQRGGM